MKKRNLKQDLTGGQVIVRCLESWGVEYVFGIPGTPITPIFDALCDSSIKLVLARHESGAAFMADGYARASGKPGVCLVTAGPGFTNAITPIADALLDSIPLIVICGQVHRHVPEPIPGENLLQELPITRMAKPIVKDIQRIENPRLLEKAMHHAFATALNGRPGPVVVEVPINISRQQAPYSNVQPTEPQPTLSKKAMMQLQRLTNILKASKRPLFLIGGGVIHAQAADKMRTLVNLTGIPIIHTLPAGGVIDPQNPLSAGMIGHFGQISAHQALHNCDTLVVFGSRMDEYTIDRRTKPEELAHIISINNDPSSVEAWIELTLSINTDITIAIKTLSKKLARTHKHSWHTWGEQIVGWKKLNKPPKTIGNKNYAAPEDIVSRITQQTNGQAIVTLGAGSHAVWGMQHYQPNMPRHLLMSGGLATMGFCLPAAIGAQLACPKEMVIGIDGDGSLQMSLQEMAVAAQEKAPIKLFVFDNGSLAMIRQNQEALFGRTIAVQLVNPDFCALARSFGWQALEIKKNAQIKDVVAKALATDGPVLVRCHIDPRANASELVS